MGLEKKTEKNLGNRVYPQVDLGEVGELEYHRRATGYRSTFSDWNNIRVSCTVCRVMVEESYLK